MHWLLDVAGYLFAVLLISALLSIAMCRTAAWKAMDPGISGPELDEALRSACPEDL